MSIDEFETFVEELCQTLTSESKNVIFSSPSLFEQRIRDLINSGGGFGGSFVDNNPHPHIFPDIPLGSFGIEVKFTVKDTWRSVANSVFESTRDKNVKQIYVIFGKMGGSPEVKWEKYEDCVMHVRTSHVPRFELEIGKADSIFKKFRIPYDEFSNLGIHEKMDYIRAYARSRLKQGERLWWLEADEDGHSLPIQARLYTSLSQDEKIISRAEAAVLCPKVFQGSRAKKKYDDVALYLLTYRGVLCHQARDLFTAGSVAGKARGGIYLKKSMLDIEHELLVALRDLPDELFEEYWGFSCPQLTRKVEWLKMADENAVGWIPSEVLFQKQYNSNLL